MQGGCLHVWDSETDTKAILVRISWKRSDIHHIFLHSVVNEAMKATDRALKIPNMLEINHIFFIHPRDDMNDSEVFADRWTHGTQSMILLLMEKISYLKKDDFRSKSLQQFKTRKALSVRSCAPLQSLHRQMSQDIKKYRERWHQECSSHEILKQFVFVIRFIYQRKGARNPDSTRPESWCLAADRTPFLAPGPQPPSQDETWWDQSAGGFVADKGSSFFVWLLVHPWNDDFSKKITSGASWKWCPISNRFYF